MHICMDVVSLYDDAKVLFWFQPGRERNLVDRLRICLVMVFKSSYKK